MEAAGFLPLTDHPLAAVIDAWGKLPEAIKAGILAIIKGTLR
jgi:hypothetical protein